MSTNKVRVGQTVRLTRKGGNSKIEGQVVRERDNIMGTPGVRVIEIQGLSHSLYTSEWDVEILAEQYEDGLYIKEGVDPKDALVLRYTLGAWSFENPENRNNPVQARFIEKVRTGETQVSKLVPEDA